MTQGMDGLGRMVDSGGRELELELELEPESSRTGMEVSGHSPGIVEKDVKLTWGRGHRRPPHWAFRVLKYGFQLPRATTTCCQLALPWSLGTRKPASPGLRVWSEVVPATPVSAGRSALTSIPSAPFQIQCIWN